MKSNLHTILLTAFLLLFGQSISAHDFEADGIYYKYLSQEDKTVSVSYQGSSYNEYSNEYSGDVVIPSSVTYNGTTYSVTSIGDYAFSNCSGLTSIEIPSSVTSIGRYAFRGCTGLTSIEIPSSLTSIGHWAFSGCSSLTSIEIPSSVTSIGDCAFNDCAKLTSIEIPSSVTSIGSSTFYGCRRLTSITVPSCVTSIGNSAFYGCYSLTSITLPSSLTSIDESAFYGCTGLTDIEIPSSVTSIGKSAFSGCTSLESVTLPFVGNKPDIPYPYPFGYIFGTEKYTWGTETTQFYYNGSSSSITYYIPTSLKSVKITGSSYIPSGAFNNCTELTSIEIPSSVTSIGFYAFDGCYSLTSITIPSSVTSIDNFAFRSCRGLTSVTALNPTPVSISSNVFTNRTNATLYVPTGSKAAYESADYWKEFKEIVEIEVLDGNYSDLDDFDNVVYMESFRTDPGEEIELPILLKNQTAGDISGFEFYLHLPTGISPVLDDEGFPIVTLSTERTTTRKHTIYGDLENDGSIHIYASAARPTYSFSDTDGEVATISLKVADNMENGIYPISLHDISMTSLSSEDPFTVSRYYLSVQIGTLTFNINDGEALAYNQTETHDELVYTRTFSSADKWQAFYVPFSIPIDTLDKYGLEVAELNDTHMYDTDEDGEFDQTTLEFLYLKRGATEPNYPYLIKSASAGDVTLTMTDVEVKTTEETEIECSTTRAVFKIRGTYAGISGAVMYANNYYAMGGGTLVRMANADSGLKPQRWYLSVENKDGSPAESLAAQMRIAIDGIEIEESETAINEVNAIGQKQDEVYMLDGRKLNGTAALKSGLYVKNHKKLFVR